MEAMTVLMKVVICESRLYGFVEVRRPWMRKTTNELVASTMSRWSDMRTSTLIQLSPSLGSLTQETRVETSLNSRRRKEDHELTSRWTVVVGHSKPHIHANARPHCTKNTMTVTIDQPSGVTIMRSG